MACAWAGFAAYAVSMVISYFAGQKYYPIRYPLKDLFFYTAVTVVLFVGMLLSNRHLPAWAAISVNTLIIVCFLAIIIRKDFPLKNLPVIGKYFQR